MNKNKSAIQKTKIAEIYSGIAQNMLVNFNQIQAQIPHSGEKGKQRELTIRKFLEKYLPKKYSVGTGQIIDKKSQISKQCDIVIYDSHNFPALYVEEGYQLFPIEAVLGTIEIKSSLTSKSTMECVENIVSIRKLTGSNSLVCCFFSYTSEYKKDPAYKIAESFVKFGSNIPSPQRFDIGCVLNQGSFMGNEGFIGTIAESDPAYNLIFFFSFLLREIGADSRIFTLLPNYSQIPLPNIKIFQYPFE